MDRSRSIYNIELESKRNRPRASMRGGEHSCASVPCRVHSIAADLDLAGAGSPCTLHGYSAQYPRVGRAPSGSPSNLTLEWREVERAHSGSLLSPSRQALANSVVIDLQQPLYVTHGACATKRRTSRVERSSPVSSPCSVRRPAKRADTEKQSSHRRRDTFTSVPRSCYPWTSHHGHDSCSPLQLVESDVINLHPVVKDRVREWGG
jgi:hypothetical protein